MNKKYIILTRLENKLLKTVAGVLSTKHSERQKALNTQFDVVYKSNEKVISTTISIKQLINIKNIIRLS